MFLTEEDVKRRLSWMEQCSEGKGNPTHGEDLERRGFCGGCGESKTIVFQKGDYGVVLRDEEGRVIAAVKGYHGPNIEILDYPKAKELAKR